MRGRFSNLFVQAVREETDPFFAENGFRADQLPRVEVLETYTGSLIMEAALTMAGGMGSVYATIKAVAELPKLADGLEDLKKRVQRRYQKRAEQTASQILPQTTPTLPPPQIFYTNLTIDARPLRSLQPDIAKDHKIHLSVAISRSGFSLENLGGEAMHDVRIGVFSSPTQRNQSSFGDAHVGLVSILSPHQTISKQINEFRDQSGRALYLDDTNPLYVDCSIQDEHGIYLFNFYLT